MNQLLPRQLASLLPRALLAAVLVAGASFDAPPADASTYKIGFANQCSKPVSLAVSYRSSDGRWIDLSRYKFEPGERNYLEDVSTSHAVFYDYAEASDNFT